MELTTTLIKQVINACEADQEVSDAITFLASDEKDRANVICNAIIDVDTIENLTAAVKANLISKIQA